MTEQHAIVGDYYLQPFESRTWYGAKKYRFRLRSALNGQVIMSNNQPIDRSSDRDATMSNLSRVTGIPIRDAH